jgi:hypothetical protein
MDPAGTMHETFDTVTEPHRRKVYPHNFPPPNAASLGLHKCLRVFPFLQNTGGFFVAVFKKVGPFGNLDRYAAGEVAEADLADCAAAKSEVAGLAVPEDPHVLYVIPPLYVNADCL